MRCPAADSMCRMAYWGPWYPIDVVKSALMGDSYLADKRKYSGTLDAVSKLYAAGGIKVTGGACTAHAR